MALTSPLRTVLLVLVLLPLLTVASSPRAVSAQSSARYLKILGLTCIETQDLTGPDEPYLTVNGVTVWSGSLREGQSIDLGVLRLPSIKFTDQVDISLYEDDMLDSDDLLGTHTVYRPPNPNFPMLSGPGWSYRLVYHIDYFP